MRRFLKYLYDRLYDRQMKFAPAEPRMEKDSKKYYAQQLVDNPIYEEIMQRIETDAITRWKNTASEAVDIREGYYMHLRVLRQIDGYVKGYIADVLIEERMKAVREQKS